MGKYRTSAYYRRPYAETERRRRTYDGCRQPPTQAASINVSLDRRGGEYEARRRDFITSPTHRRCERLHNRYR